MLSSLGIPLFFDIRSFNLGGPVQFRSSVQQLANREEGHHRQCRGEGEGKGQPTVGLCELSQSGIAEAQPKIGGGNWQDETPPLESIEPSDENHDFAENRDSASDDQSDRPVSLYQNAGRFDFSRVAELFDDGETQTSAREVTRDSAKSQADPAKQTAAYPSEAGAE